MLLTQIGTLARRSTLKTLRQPFQMFPVIFFPIILLYQGWSLYVFRKRITGPPSTDHVDPVNLPVSPTAGHRPR